MLEQCAQRVAKGRDALLPAYCTLCEVIHARANLRGGGGGVVCNKKMKKKTT